MLLQNVTAVRNAARNAEGTPEGNGGVLSFEEPAKGKVALVVRGLTAWGNVANSGGVIYADSGTVLLMSGVLAYGNNATVGGVVAC